jgi:hypothetical protein
LADVAEEDLRALYSGAEALLFPSLEEGFGWPIAEAQACGCPVVTSNRAPMTEVGGDAAFYVDPLDYESAAATTAGIIGLRKELHDASVQNASRFDTQKMIDAYVELYSRLLGRKSSPRFDMPIDERSPESLKDSKVVMSGAASGSQLVFNPGAVDSPDICQPEVARASCRWQAMGMLASSDPALDYLENIS